MKTIRTDFPAVRFYQKNGETYFIVDCRRKGWLGTKRLGFSSKMEALNKAREIAEKVTSEGYNGANAVSSVTTDKNLKSWSAQLAV